MQSLRSRRGGGQGVLALLAIVCIAVAGYFIIKQTKPKKGEAFGNAFYYCMNCKKEFVDTSDKVPPIKCPFCKQVTAVGEIKYKCKKCEEAKREPIEFVGWFEKWDPESKRFIERRKAGEDVPDAQIGSILVSPPDREDWMDSTTEEAIALMNNVACPNPECGASGVDIDRIFPKVEK